MTANGDEGETWRYEVRGSSLYDTHEQRHLSIFEAGEILNAHEALLLKEGRWAAKAGLAEARAAAAGTLKAALEHATWMNRWQFDEHRTGGAGELKDEAFCRCDWCKTYRDTRHDDAAALEAARAAGL